MFLFFLIPEGSSSSLFRYTEWLYFLFCYIYHKCCLDILKEGIAIFLNQWECAKKKMEDLGRPLFCIKGYLRFSSHSPDNFLTVPKKPSQITQNTFLRFTW